MLQIKVAELPDIDVLLSLWKQYRKDYEAMLFDKNPQLKEMLVKKENALDVFREETEARIQSADSIVLLALEDGTPVGFSVSYSKKNYPIYVPETIGQIDIFYIIASHRRRGISSKFYKKILRWFAEKGIRQISLDVYAETQIARAIYKKWGFIDVCINMRNNL